jgi:hypothetical protein
MSHLFRQETSMPQTSASPLHDPAVHAVIERANGENAGWENGNKDGCWATDTGPGQRVLWPAAGLRLAFAAWDLNRLPGRWTSARLARRYSPLAPVRRELFLRPDTPLDASVKTVIAGQLDTAQGQFAAIWRGPDADRGLQLP